MNNNTKIRLRLSKNLFESLTREILAEAKKGDMSGGAYTEAVKMPKAGKMDEKMSSKEKMAKGLYNEVGAEEETHGMKKEAPGAPPMPSVPGKSAVDKLNLAGTNMEIKDAKTFAKAILDIAQKLQSKEGFKPESNPNIKRAMDALRTLSSGAPAMPQVPTNKSANSAPKAPPMPGLKEKMSSKEKMAKGLYNEVDAEMDTKKMKEAMDFDNAHNYTYRLVDGNCIRINPETQERAKVHHTYCNDLKKEMQTNVAEEGQMNEMVDVSWEAVAAGMAAMGLAPLAIDKMHQWWKKKYPGSFKKAQGLSAAMDKQAGNTPGQGHGVDTSKTFGPRENALKEYENDDYRLVNGECRRYNDEHEYVVVSMSNCR